MKFLFVIEFWSGLPVVLKCWCPAESFFTICSWLSWGNENPFLDVHRKTNEWKRRKTDWIDSQLRHFIIKILKVHQSAIKATGTFLYWLRHNFYDFFLTERPRSVGVWFTLAIKEVPIGIDLIAKQSLYCRPRLTCSTLIVEGEDGVRERAYPWIFEWVEGHREPADSFSRDSLRDYKWIRFASLVPERVSAELLTDSRMLVHYYYCFELCVCWLTSAPIPSIFSLTLVKFSIFHNNSCIM